MGGWVGRTAWEEALSGNAFFTGENGGHFLPFLGEKGGGLDFDRESGGACFFFRMCQDEEEGLTEVVYGPTHREEESLIIRACCDVVGSLDVFCREKIHHTRELCLLGGWVGGWVDGEEGRRFELSGRSGGWVDGWVGGGEGGDWNELL